MALCTICGSSNAGLGGVPLVQVDDKFYCKRCLIKTKGIIRCSICGMAAGSTNDPLTSLPDGKYICASCLERQQSAAATEAAAARGSPAPTTAAPLVINLPIEPLAGGLKKAYDESVPSTEKVLFVLAASGGEGLVATERRVIVLKAGFASGSPSGQKARAFSYDTITGIELKTGLVQGWLQILAPGVRPISGAAGDAYQAENTVTFLTDAKAKFEQAARALQKLVERAQN